ncbi:DeoR family transcriptional regulator [bacterium]|nr:DeoR family transcriptional regulator [bacterium]
MKKQNYGYLLFLLLVPVVVIYYLFMKKRGARRPVIVRRVFPPKVKVQEALKVENLKPESTFASNGLNDRQMRVMDYISERGEGKVSDMVKLFAQTDRTLRRDLNKLEKMGFVKRNGSTKSVNYTLAK